MDFEILVVFCYGRESIAFRIGLCSTIGQVNKFLCQKWSSLSPLSIELSFLRDGKKNLIETDAELQSLAAYVFAKKLNTFDIIVGVVESACNALVYSEACNSSSSCVQNYDEQGEVRQPLKSSYWATLLDSVGQTFPGGAEQFRTTLLKYSIETGFKVYMLKNDKSRVIAVCGMKDVTGCKWRVHASCPNHPSLFKIKRLNSAHTCGSGFRDSRNPPMTKKLVKSLILNQVRDKPLIKPKEIVDIFKSDYGVTLGYYFAYAGKELALKQIYGDDKLFYSNLRWFADSLIRTNPGSRVVLEVNPVTNKFERIFISFEACIHGFEFCRPLLFLDGTFLKSKYKGYLLAATGKNGNEGIFPLAYAVIVSEDDANWLWFLQNLKTVVSPVRRLTFISDRHPGLVNNVKDVFPNCSHNYCFWHLKNNLRSALSSKNPLRHHILNLFTKCVYAPTHAQFQDALADLLSMGGNPVQAFCDRTPFECWANAYFVGNRYGELCSNVAESFNAWIRKERYLPITAMVNQIRSKVMMLMSDRRESSIGWTSILCPELEKKLEEKISAGRTWRVSKSREFVYEVHSERSQSVDLSRSSCTCNQWKIQGFPCEHAVCCIQSIGESVYDYIDPYFTSDYFRRSYSHAIEPIPNFDMPRVVSEVATIEPPDTRKGPGRHRVNRIPNTGSSSKRARLCSRCRTYGHHNRSTCAAEI